MICPLHHIPFGKQAQVTTIYHKWNISRVLVIRLSFIFLIAHPPVWVTSERRVPTLVATSGSQ